MKKLFTFLMTAIAVFTLNAQTELNFAIPKYSKVMPQSYWDSENGWTSVPLVRASDTAVLKNLNDQNSATVVVSESNIYLNDGLIVIDLLKARTITGVEIKSNAGMSNAGEDIGAPFFQCILSNSIVDRGEVSGGHELTNGFDGSDLTMTLSSNTRSSVQYTASGKSKTSYYGRYIMLYAWADILPGNYYADIQDIYIYGTDESVIGGVTYEPKISGGSATFTSAQLNVAAANIEYAMFTKSSYYPKTQLNFSNFNFGGTLTIYAGTATSGKQIASFSSKFLPTTPMVCDADTISFKYQKSSTTDTWTVTCSGISKDPLTWLTQNANIYYNAGNVGVGTNNPTEKLEVKGNILADTIKASKIIGERLSQWSTISKGTSLYFNKTGVIGIGTASPDSLYRLDVLGKSRFTGKLYVSDTARAASFIGDGSKLINIKSFWKKNATDTAKMYYSSGNVGIGTNTPQTELDVMGAIRSSKTISTSLIRPADLGAGAIDFTNNGFGYQYSTKYFTFRSPDYSEAYGLTNDYGTGTSAQLSIVAKQATGNIAFYTGNQATEKMRITASGFVGIGTNSPTSALTVKGKITAGEIEILEVGKIPDFVFAADYKLRSLTEIEAFVKENKHLPEVPSEKEFKANGMNLVEMNTTLLKKVEELTLYLIDLKKENEKLMQRVDKLEKK